MDLQQLIYDEILATRAEVRALDSKLDLQADRITIVEQKTESTAGVIRVGVAVIVATIGAVGTAIGYLINLAFHK